MDILGGKKYLTLTLPKMDLKSEFLDCLWKLLSFVRVVVQISGSG